MSSINGGLQPDPAQTDQVVQMLRHSQSSDNNVQRQVRENFEILQTNPEFNGYLAHIFAISSDIDVSVRSVAGILLKNNCLHHFNKFSEPIRNFIIETMFRAFGDPYNLIRSTAGSLLSCVVRADQYRCWPDVIYPNVNACISWPVADEVKAEGCFLALNRLIEDCDRTIGETLGMKCAMEILAKCGQIFHHPDVNLRFAASECFVALLYNCVPIEESILKDLFAVATDEDCRIRKNVCKTLVIIVHRELETLFPCFAEFLQYILDRINDPDEHVAIEACEVWSALADQPAGRDLIEPCIKKLAPLLLSKMKYDKNDPALTAGNANEEGEVFYEGGARRDRRTMASGDSDESDIEENAGPSWNDGNIQWSLRKGAASNLDQLSHVFAGGLLPHLLPSLQETMLSPDWLVKESAILALGAISEGCYDSMIQFLPQLMPYLFSCLNDPKPLVRSISCWTAGRYSSWIVEQPDQAIFVNVINDLLIRIKDPNKRVQEAACSAFAIFEEEAGVKLCPFVPAIVETFAGALKQYKSKNLLILYDTIATLADCTQGRVEAKYFTDVLLPSLLGLLNNTKDDDTSIFSLLECLTSIAGTVGKSFLPHAEMIFRRCVSIIRNTLQEQVDNMDQGVKFHERDFIIVPLDSMSGLVEALGVHLEHLISQLQLVEIIVRHLTNNRMPEIRQSSIALIGDLARTCISTLKPYMPAVIHSLHENLDPAQIVAVRNNAVWAIGEVISRLDAQEVDGYVGAVLSGVIQVITAKVCQKSLADNAAISVSKLSGRSPQQVAERLGEFVKPWFKIVCEIHDVAEKEKAFEGICEAIKLNPSAILDDFMLFCEAAASFKSEISPEVKQTLSEILRSYKMHVGEQRWNEFRCTMSPALQGRMALLYNM